VRSFVICSLTGYQLLIVSSSGKYSGNGEETTGPCDESRSESCAANSKFATVLGPLFLERCVKEKTFFILSKIHKKKEKSTIILPCDFHQDQYWNNYYYFGIFLMSQRPIREYDAKKMFADYADRPYIGFLVTNEEEINSLPAWLEKEQVDTRVVKPDQLFGKRSKLGLVGVKLDASGIQQWIQTHREQEITIDGVKDTLHTFLIEPFVPHTEEYYLSFATKREEDTIRFSARGGVDIEEQRETVKTVGVPVLDELEDHHLEELLEKGKQKNEKIMKGLIKNLFSFFRSYGFTSLEINPFCFDETGGLHLLDMVASVDTCETYRQAKNWKILKRVKPFGAVQHLAEKKIEELDEKTGASLKLTIINPDGRLWFLL